MQALLMEVVRMVVQYTQDKIWLLMQIIMDCLNSQATMFQLTVERQRIMRQLMLGHQGKTLH